MVPTCGEKTTGHAEEVTIEKLVGPTGKTFSFPIRGTGWVNSSALRWSFWIKKEVRCESNNGVEKSKC